MKRIEVKKIATKSCIDEYIGVDDNFHKHNLIIDFLNKASDTITVESKTIEKPKGFIGKERIEHKMTAFIMTEKDFLETLRLLHFIHSALPHDMKAYSDKLHSLLLGDNEMNP